MTGKGQVLLLKGVVWLAALAPLAWALWRFFLGDGLGTNPIEKATHISGTTALVTLIAALAVTPVRRVTGWNRIQKVRRLVGLFAYFWVFLHFMVWMGLDQFFAWEFIGEDIAERPFILVGFTAFLLLTPLALTSTRGWIRRLGRNWQRLHRLVYVAAVLAVVHYLWVTRADDRGPFIAGSAVTLLLGIRLWWTLRRRRRRPTP